MSAALVELLAPSQKTADLQQLASAAMQNHRNISKKPVLRKIGAQWSVLSRENHIDYELEQTSGLWMRETWMSLSRLDE
jgi:hypothetical protein